MFLFNGCNLGIKQFNNVFCFCFPQSQGASFCRILMKTKHMVDEPTNNHIIDKPHPAFRCKIWKKNILTKIHTGGTSFCEVTAQGKLIITSDKSFNLKAQ